MRRHKPRYLVKPRTHKDDYFDSKRNDSFEDWRSRMTDRIRHFKCPDKWLCFSLYLACKWNWCRYNFKGKKKCELKRS